jgi:hypothetical protein
MVTDGYPRCAAAGAIMAERALWLCTLVLGQLES